MWLQTRAGLISTGPGTIIRHEAREDGCAIVVINGGEKSDLVFFPEGPDKNALISAVYKRIVAAISVGDTIFSVDLNR
jgi:hypothetical protein